MAAFPPAPWTSPETVAGFSQSPPNATLLQFAARERADGGARAIDIGCGAARNAAPLACQGWQVVALDSSRPMIDAARQRARAEHVDRHIHLAVAVMDGLPVADASMDLVIAHGIWNLARSGSEFRRAVSEAVRVARGGAALFLFIFSRHSLPNAADPLPGETFVYTQFSGQPQCFLTEHEILAELGRAGFVPDRAVPLAELNLPRPGALPTSRVPVFFEGAFRRTR
jgi:SAM-dependent methyltransferase